MFPDFIDIRILDTIDIIMVGILVYYLYKIVRGTVAIRIFVGIISIYLIWKLVGALKMDLLTEILGQFIGVGVIALIIVFQQELRRFLLLIGTTGGMKDGGMIRRLLGRKKDGESELEVEPIVESCFNMAKTLTGALIVINKTPDLPVSSYGDRIDAELSARMLESLFYKNSPMHDGAVIVANNRIQYARCVLPVTENQNFPAHLGMRHRSALGITETSDAVAISVSEQTGGVSYCTKGELISNVTKEELTNFLKNRF